MAAPCAAHAANADRNTNDILIASPFNIVYPYVVNDKIIVRCDCRVEFGDGLPGQRRISTEDTVRPQAETAMSFFPGASGTSRQHTA